MLNLLRAVLLLLTLVVLAPGAWADEKTDDAKKKLTVMLDWFVNPYHAALVVAREKGFFAAQGLEDRVRVVESDLFAGLGAQKYDLIVTNPPYVSAEELAALPAEYHREPRLGLAGGANGLDLVLRILREASRYLKEDGVLIVEVGKTAAALEALFPEIPFMWIEFERGGEGVFLLDRARLLEYQPLFARETTAS